MCCHYTVMIQDFVFIILCTVRKWVSLYHEILTLLISTQKNGDKELK